MKIENVYLLPTPKKIEYDNVVERVAPVFYTEVSDFMPLCEVGRECLSKIFETEIRNVCQKHAGIELKLDTTLKGGEYRIDGRCAYASGYEGASYAVATLLQLIVYEHNKDEYYLPLVKLSDSPDVEYRALMVDLARFWHPKRVILSYIDLCFFYKIKYLHLHFMDTGCYTLPSRKFPLLPTKGKHYTEEDINDIRAYAKSRGIILIPEIEMPGHAYELNRTYPERFADRLSDETVEKIRTRELPVPMHYNAAVCAGSDACFEGLCELIDEVLDMFPEAKLFHIGGDEAPHEVWNYCPVCKDRMQRKGFTTTSELYCEIVSRLTEYVISKGRTPLVWEGFSKYAAHLIPKETVVYFWDGGFNSAKNLLDDGFRVVNCSWNPTYVVPGYHRYTISDILNFDILRFQNKDNDAQDEIINVGENKNVLGAQLGLWEAPFEYESAFAMENLMALSERLWARNNSLSEDNFNIHYKNLRRKIFHLIMDR